MIERRMNRGNIEDRLIITPLLNPSESLDPVSVNVRLGNQFIIMKKQSFEILDVASWGELNKNIARYQEKKRIDYGDKFILHRNQLVIGSTLEYVSMPGNLMCYVTGKSTWGRTGLIIATATKVDPGFKGCITLEIINEGEIPIVLYPGLPIAQLIFHEVTGNIGYMGKYQYAVGPEFPSFDKDYEKLKLWFG
jgi:dCTP deaminase